jgi:hypothetical protein
VPRHPVVPNDSRNREANLERWPVGDFAAILARLATTLDSQSMPILTIGPGFTAPATISARPQAQ